MDAELASGTGHCQENGVCHFNMVLLFQMHAQESHRP